MHSLLKSKSTRRNLNAGFTERTTNSTNFRNVQLKISNVPCQTYRFYRSFSTTHQVAKTSLKLQDYLQRDSFFSPKFPAKPERFKTSFFNLRRGFVDQDPNSPNPGAFEEATPEYLARIRFYADWMYGPEGPEAWRIPKEEMEEQFQNPDKHFAIFDPPKFKNFWERQIDDWGRIPTEELGSMAGRDINRHPWFDTAIDKSFPSWMQGRRRWQTRPLTPFTPFLKKGYKIKPFHDLYEAKKADILFFMYKWLSTYMRHIAAPLSELAKKTGKPKEDLLAEILNHPLILSRVEYYYRKARSRRGRKSRYKAIARWRFLFIYPAFILMVGIMIQEWWTQQEKVDQYWPKLRMTASSLFQETYYTVEPLALADERTIKYLGAPLATDEITIKRSFDGDSLGGVMRFPIFGSIANGMVTCWFNHVAYRTWEITSCQVDLMNGMTFFVEVPPDKKFLSPDELNIRRALEEEYKAELERRTELYRDMPNPGFDRFVDIGVAASQAAIDSSMNDGYIEDILEDGYIVLQAMYHSSGKPHIYSPYMNYGPYPEDDKRAELEMYDERNDDIHDEDFEEQLLPDPGSEEYLEEALNGFFELDFEPGNWTEGHYDEDLGETVEWAERFHEKEDLDEIKEVMDMKLDVPGLGWPEEMLDETPEVKFARKEAHVLSRRGVKDLHSRFSYYIPGNPHVTNILIWPMTHDTDDLEDPNVEGEYMPTYEAWVASRWDRINKQESWFDFNDNLDGHPEVVPIANPNEDEEQTRVPFERLPTNRLRWNEDDGVRPDLNKRKVKDPYED